MKKLVTLCFNRCSYLVLAGKKSEYFTENEYIKTLKKWGFIYKKSKQKPKIDPLNGIPYVRYDLVKSEIRCKLGLEDIFELERDFGNVRIGKFKDAKRIFLD